MRAVRATVIATGCATAGIAGAVIGYVTIRVLQLVDEAWVGTAR